MSDKCSNNSTSTASVSSSTSSQCPDNKRQRVEPNDESSSNSDLNSSASSLTTITTDLSLILRQFECCVCLEHITPPILQCRNAHIFCQTCRQKLRTPATCPECREYLPIGDSRCHHLERLAIDLCLSFPCKYSSSGCSVGSILTEKKNHEMQCEYRPYKCWESEEVECEWSGNKEQMFQHLIDVHQNESHDLDSDQLTFKVTGYNQQEWTQWSEMVTFKEQHFVFILTRDSDAIITDVTGLFSVRHDIVKFKAILLFIGEQRIADQYQYTIELSDPSNRQYFHFRERPHSVRQEVSQLLERSNRKGFAFDENLIKRFTDDNQFIIKLNITEEDIDGNPSENTVKSDKIITLDNVY